MLKQRSARTVNHAFRQTCRARRIQNVERVIERQPLELDCAPGACRKFRPRLRPRDVRDVRVAVAIGNYDDFFDGWYLPSDLCCSCETVNPLACIRVAVGAEENPRLDLPE